MTAAAPSDSRPPRVWPGLLTVVSLASLPYLRLVAANRGEVLQAGRVALWWGVTLAVGLAATGVAGLLSGRRAMARVAALTGVGLYLWFHYRPIAVLGDAVGAPLDGLAWWGVVAAIVLVLSVPATGSPVGQRFLAIAGPLLLVVPLAQLLAPAPAPAEVPASALDSDAVPELAHRPDVWWFVLDGLGGTDVLAEHGVDVDAFSDLLRDRGFQVQEQAWSSYPLTHLAVPTILEQEYLYEGSAEPPSAPYFARLQGDNRTVDTFLANGYSYAHAYPGLWTGSRCGGREDLCLGDHGPVSDTQRALLSSTPWIEVATDGDTAAGIAAANDPALVVEQVLAADLDAPTFALVHQLNPHPPYLRDADCRIRDVSLSLAAWGRGGEYADATTCLFDRLTAAVDRILAASDDPVIIIQGDHGPRLGLSAATTGQVELGGKQFLSAFSAMRLPDACRDAQVPDDLTLVNTFRIVTACLADEPADLLPRRLFPIVRDYGGGG